MDNKILLRKLQQLVSLLDHPEIQTLSQRAFFYFSARGILNEIDTYISSEQLLEISEGTVGTNQLHICEHLHRLRIHIGVMTGFEQSPDHTSSDTTDAMKHAEALYRSLE